MEAACHWLTPEGSGLVDSQSPKDTNFSQHDNEVPFFWSSRQITKANKSKLFLAHEFSFYVFSHRYFMRKLCLKWLVYFNSLKNFPSLLNHLLCPAHWNIEERAAFYRIFYRVSDCSGRLLKLAFLSSDASKLVVIYYSFCITTYLVWYYW